MECLCCHKKSIGEVKVDLDIAGFPYCEEHEQSVRMAVLLVLHGHNPKAIEKLIERKNITYGTEDRQQV